MRHFVFCTVNLALLASIAGCGGDEPETLRESLARLSDDSIAQQSTTPPAADPREWTAGIVERPRPDIRPVTLREVRAARNEGFDRVVFEFADNPLPGYHLEYIDEPVRECGSGETVEVAGDGWLLVRLTPARAHEFIGESAEVTVRDRDRTFDHPALRQLTLICDFEGQVAWVLGVESPNRYRVLDLREPARLVVDVRH